MAEPEITEDALLGGKIRIRQPKRGYRVNVDTLLLAAAVRLETEGGAGRVVELGCGVGAALLAVAQRYAGFHPFARFVGIERDENIAALAKQNVTLNNLGASAEIIISDALALGDDIGSFDAVFFNPPYDYPGEGREPSPERRNAHIADAPLDDWIKVWSNRMRSDATMTIIHRAERLPEILGSLEGRLGGVNVIPIRPNPGAPAKRVIVRARKGARGPLRLWAGLDLHPDRVAEGKYTPEADAILRGEAVLFG